MEYISEHHSNDLFSYQNNHLFKSFGCQMALFMRSHWVPQVSGSLLPVSSPVDKNINLPTYIANNNQCVFFVWKKLVQLFAVVGVISKIIVVHVKC